MEKCWATDPFNRPTTQKLATLFKNLYENYSNSELEGLDKVIDLLDDGFIQYNPEMTHPQAIYINRYLSFMQKDIVSIFNCKQLLKK